MGEVEGTLRPAPRKEISLNKTPNPAHLRAQLQDHVAARLPGHRPGGGVGDQILILKRFPAGTAKEEVLILAVENGAERRATTRIAVWLAICGRTTNTPLTLQATPPLPSKCYPRSIPNGEAQRRPSW